MSAALSQELPPATPLPSAREVSAIMRRLDRCGATFSAVTGSPGWYVALYTDPAISDRPRRWACSVEEWDCERPFALAFKARAERAVL